MIDESLMDFFDATTSLVKNCPKENLLALKGLVISSTGYGSLANPEVTVRFVYFASQVVCSPRTFEDDTPEFINSTMTSLTVVVINTCACGRLKNRLANKVQKLYRIFFPSKLLNFQLFRAIGDILLSFPYTDHSFSSMIISAVFSAFESIVSNDNNQKERLEMLCRLVDSEKLYIPEIHKWACKVMQEQVKLFSAYPSQFSYLCLAVGTSLPNDFPKVFYKDCQASMYGTARSAFRNGQWKHVASPNLASIDLSSLPEFERKWITALREIADSQLLEIEPDQLEKQQSHLSSALSALKSGKSNTRFGNDLRFPIGMVSAMLSSSYAHFHLLSVIRPFIFSLSGALQTNSFFNPVVAQRLLVAVSDFFFKKKLTKKENESGFASMRRGLLHVDLRENLYYTRTSWNFGLFSLF